MHDKIFSFEMLIELAIFIIKRLKFLKTLLKYMRLVGDAMHA